MNPKCRITQGRTFNAGMTGTQRRLRIPCKKSIFELVCPTRLKKFNYPKETKISIVTKIDRLKVVVLTLWLENKQCAKVNKPVFDQFRGRFVSFVWTHPMGDGVCVRLSSPA
jgi:hypothetical protein